MKAPIIKAAIWIGKLIIIGERHGLIIQELARSGMLKKLVTQDQQGFIDAEGKYLDRKEAYIRAVECGQLKDDGVTKKLLSEMVW